MSARRLSVTYRLAAVLTHAAYKYLLGMTLFIKDSRRYENSIMKQHLGSLPNEDWLE